MRWHFGDCFVVIRLLSYVISSSITATVQNYDNSYDPFTKEVNPGVAKSPLEFNGGLPNVELTPLVKYVTVLQQKTKLVMLWLGGRFILGTNHLT